MTLYTHQSVQYVTNLRAVPHATGQKCLFQGLNTQSKQTCLNDVKIFYLVHLYAILLQIRVKTSRSQCKNDCRLQHLKTNYYC